MARRTGRRHLEIPDEYYSEIIRIILEEDITKKNEIQSLKLRLCRKYHLPVIPGDPDVLEHAPENRRRELENVLRLKPMRTASGVSPVAVMTSPEYCPHGVCIYCPGGVENNSPQSYTGQEPAALRAWNNRFDPYSQTLNRLKQYREIGHATDKIDLIIMGGTFTSRTMQYQRSFIKGCYDALNMKEAPDLQTALQWNETAPHRCIGLTIETRPDRCLSTEIEQILLIGGTRVELGVQTTNNEVLGMVKRGHTTKETILSTRLVKDAGIKLAYHMMPGLPGSSPEMDLETFEEIFNNADYRPDMLKIYPTLVIKGTELYNMWKKGEYTPLTTEDAVRLLKEVKKIIPGYVRIQRIQRDIPARLIEAGVRKSNLRQLVNRVLQSEGERCHCIRCREVGHTTRKAKDVELVQMEYEASRGTEVFFSYEDVPNEVLVGYLRLRIPSEGSENGRKERVIVRELKVSGREVPLGEREKGTFQHLGYGRKLLERAEEFASDGGARSIIVTSGVGVRPYYLRLGYERSGTYMEKRL